MDAEQAAPQPAKRKTSADPAAGPHLPHPPQRQRTPHTVGTHRHKHEDRKQYVAFAIVLAVVLLAVRFSSPGSPVPAAGPFTQHNRAPTTGPEATCSPPTGSTPPREVSVAEAKRAAIGSCETPTIRATIASLDKYDPFALFPKLHQSLTDIGHWKDTAMAWRLQKAQRTRALSVDLDDFVNVVDAEWPAPATMMPDSAPEDEHPSVQPLVIADLDNIEAAVSFLRVRLTKLQSLFTIINDDSRLNDKKRFELLDRLAVNRRAAIGVGDYLCTPFDHVFEWHTRTRRDGLPSIDELILREAPVNMETLEETLGRPESAVHTNAPADTAADAATNQTISLEDMPAVAERVRDLQRRLLYTCYVFHTRKRLGSAALQVLFEEMKSKIRSDVMHMV